MKYITAAEYSKPPAAVLHVPAGRRGAADHEALVSQLQINGEAARGRGHVTPPPPGRVTLADPAAAGRESRRGKRV